MNSVILGRKQLHLLWSTATIPFDHKISACSWNRPTIKICNASWEAKWVGVCFEKETEKKTYMQRTLCQVFPAEGKLPVGGFAARKILPCKLCDNCGRSVCNHLILSGYILCCLVLTEAPWTSSQGWKRHTSNSWKQSTWSSGLYGKRMERNLSLFRSLGQIYQ